jgi:hypothetical protein
LNNYTSDFFLRYLDWIGLDCQWWSSTPARGPQDESNVHRVLSLMFASTYFLFWLMRVKLNRPPKPEESQKNSSFNGKPIHYPRYEPETSRLAHGSHNLCTIGSV